MSAEAASERAPGALELVRRFENTVELPGGPDELATLEGARNWCLSYGLVPPATAAEVTRLRDFRERLRDVLFANNGEGDRNAAWASLAPFLSTARLALNVDLERGLGLRPSDAAGDGAIAALLAVVYEALVNGTWPRLRACRKQSCQWAYYDHTKNASRAWCSMATCGNREKAQRRRQRERASTRSA